MLTELKRCNSIGDKAGIRFFISLLAVNRSIPKREIQSRCALERGIRINYPGMIAFFEYLGLIEINSSNIKCVDSCPDWAQMSAEQAVDILTELCILRLIDDGLFDSNSFGYNANEDKLCLQHSTFPLEYAAIRNFLFSVSALQTMADGSIAISQSCEAVFVVPIRERRRKMTLDELKRRQEEQSRRGLEAEEFVLAFEMNRLPEQARRIKRISDFDVAAGYDIVSFSSQSATCHDRFIEVKTYIGEPHFYWSENEVDIAKIKGIEYVLCLVDYNRMKESGYQPNFYPDPYSTILGSAEWLISPSTYRVEKIRV